MTNQEREQFIKNLYRDLFHNGNVNLVPDYCANDFEKTNNYDTSNYEAFIGHIEDISGRTEKADFDLQFLVNNPSEVVVRTLVTINTTPISYSLLISYWGFNNTGKINRCNEVELSQSSCSDLS